MDELLAMSPAAKALAVGLWFVLLVVGERLFPAAVPPERARFPGPGWRRLLTNGGFWVFNVILSLSIVLPLTQAAATAFPALGAWRPGWWSGAVGLLLDLLLLDFLIYWWHRANHVVPLLWRFHEVHHRDEFLDASSAVRFHFGEVALSALARAAIMIPLGLQLPSILAFETLVLVGALFHHSNLRLPPKLELALSWIVVTPSIHWVHHHKVRADTDSNYATVLSLWDRLFGSRSKTQRSLTMAIGVEGRREESFGRLLVLPFSRRDQ
jgi:sterol desaturase/sphingolipid hydroxylase (fatty acid hydroxylase superfamily)